MNIERLADKVNEFVEDLFLEEEVIQLTTEQMTKWPLDRRARPPRMFSDGEMLAVPTRYVKSLDYYGGFEYVDSEHRVVLGEWVVFSNEDSRVAEVLDAMLGEVPEEVNAE